MTPIKYILVSGTNILTVDLADMTELQATAMTADKAQWVGWSLAKAHAVKLILEENPND